MRKRSGEVPGWTLCVVSLVLALGPLSCQRSDEHAPFAAGCMADCRPSGISIGSGSSGPSGSGTSPTQTDAGFNAGTLTGSVLLLNDSSFARSAAFQQAASISGEAASGGLVSGAWDGAAPYTLSGLTVEDTNWITVSPGVQADALITIQAVQTDATDTADLAVVDSATLDSVFTAVANTRAPALGQVILFFRNAGTGALLSGIQATMASADTPAYAESSGWVLQDATTTTGPSGLVVFGNVTVPLAGSTTQVVSVLRPATSTTTAVNGGTFAVPVAEGAVTIASIPVRL